MTRRRNGFALIEILVAVVVLGVIAAPLSGLLVTTIRVAERTERQAQRTAIAVTAASIVQRVDVFDECDGGDYRAAVLDRVALDDGWVLVVDADCTTPDLIVLTVDVIDGRGDRLTVVAARGSDL